MKVLRFSLITCIALGISATLVDSANAGFTFKNGKNDGSLVDRHVLWNNTNDGAITLQTAADWAAAKGAIDAGVDVELAVYYIIDSLRSNGSEYYSLASDGELTGVVWGMKVEAITSFSPGFNDALFYQIELSVADDGAQFRMWSEDGADPVTDPFVGFDDPALNRAALAAGQPFDNSGAVESGTARLDGEVIGDNLDDGKFIVLNVQVLDGGGTLIDGISAASTVYVDVHSDGLDGTDDHLIQEDGQGTSGSGRDIRLNTRFFFNGDEPTEVAGFGDPQNVTGVSTDPFNFTVIPEPSSFALFGIGAPFLIGMALRRRKKNKATS